MVSRIVLDLTEHVGRTATGDEVTIPIALDDAETVAAWCARTGNQLVHIDNDTATVRRGRDRAVTDVLTELPPERRPGTRLWLYTNFDCNLACDYCCARSSPHAIRRELGIDTIRRLVTEAADADVAEIFLTGGEPFMLNDLDLVAATCASTFPTTLLTNGMLFRGTRLAMLRRMPRDNLALQISLDSATADLHDLHRGRGSWQRALDGIHTALAEGFRVRVAATVAADHPQDAEILAFQQLLDELGIARPDQLIRPIAKRGFAEDGLVLTTDTLLPEITITADGIYWHPVGVDHDDQLVSHTLFPLKAAINEVQRRFITYRLQADTAARSFPCA